MALDRLTKVDGGGISTTSDYRVGIITASKFVGPFDGTGGNFSGVVTATNGVFSGNISAVDGNFSGNVTIGGTLTYEDVTNIDSVGLITARDGIDCNGDIDVDGHTNLDNASVAGVSTFSDKVIIGGGASRSAGWEHLLQVEHTNSLPHGISLIGNRANSYGPNLTFGKTRSASLGGNTIVQDNDTLAQLVFRGSDGVDLANISAMVGVVVDGTPAENNVPGAFEIYTGGFNKRLTIDASGNVLIGTTDNTIYNDSSGEGVVIRGGDCIDINRTSDSMLNLNRLGSDGQYINFRRDGSVKAVLSSRDNTFCIDVNGYERLRVDTNGDVLFGTTDDTIYNNSSGEGVVIRNGDCIDIARNNDNQLFLNRQGGDGYHIAFIRDGSYKSFISTRSNAFCIDVNGSERLRIDSSGQVRIANTDLTASSSADDLIVGTTSGSRGLTIFSGTGNTGNIFFADTDTTGTGNRMGTITYDHSGNFMRFSTTGNQERLRIDSSGRLLVGTTTEGHNNADDLTIATTGHTGITLRSGTSNNGSVFFSDGTSGADEYRGWVQYTHTSNYLTFGTNASERLRIDSAGRLSLGDTATGSYPVATQARQVQAEIKGSISGNDYHHGSLALNCTNNNANLFIVRSQNIQTSGVGLGSICFTGFDGSDFHCGSRITVARDATGGNNSIPCRLEFLTTANGASSPSERLRIDSTGRVIIANDGSGGTADVNADNFVVKNYTNSGSCGISILNADNQNSTLYFGNASDNKHAEVVWSDASNLFLIGTSNTGASIKFRVSDQADAILIDNNGNLKISNNTARIRMGSNNQLELYHTGTYGYLNDTSSSGTELRIAGRVVRVMDNDSSHTIAYFSQSNAKFYANNVERLKTTDEGITVVGEVASSQDFPDFKPSLDLNFAATKKLDPRIKFARQGVASYYDALGNVKFAADNEPRFDHDPDTGECKGLLIEQDSINLIAGSADEGSDTRGVYSTLGNGFSINELVSDVIRPTGTPGLVRRVKSHASGNSGGRWGGYSGSGGSPYAGSFWARSVTGTSQVAIDVNDTGYNVTTLTTKWVRVEAVGTTGNNYDFMDISFPNTSDDIYIWGMQLEQNEYASSYIRNSKNSTQAYRGADTAFIDGESFDEFYNQSEGTIVSSHSLLPNVSATQNCYTYQVAPDSGTSEAPFRLIDRNSSYGNSLVATSVSSSSSVAFFRASGNPVTPANKKMKIAFAIKTNDFAASFNGGTAVTDTAGTFSQTNDHISIGYYKPVPQAYLNGHIQRLTYYPKRLSNTQLQNLTS